MKERGEKSPYRGQWMVAEGRELYHEWLTDLLVRHPAREADYCGVFDFREANDAPLVVRNSLSLFSQAFSEQLIDRTTPRDMQLLIESMDDIKRYTSADEMNGEFPNWPKAITRHAQDGLDFACRVSVGLAYDAYEAAGYPVESSVHTYKVLSGIMHNPSFHQVLEEFSITGFGVLRNQTRNVMLQSDMPEATGKIIGLKSLVDRIVHVSRDTGSSVRYALDPVIAEQLIDRMREQNKDHFSPTTNSMTIRGWIKEPSFTTGCPVRKAPASEIKQGNEMSGIALLSQYMGDELLRAVRLQERRTELAETAIRNLQVTV